MNKDKLSNDINRLFKYVDRIGLPSKQRAMKSFDYMLNIRGIAIADTHKDRAIPMISANIGESVRELSIHYGIPTPEIVEYSTMHQRIRQRDVGYRLLEKALAEYGTYTNPYMMYYPCDYNLSYSIIVYDVNKILGIDDPQTEIFDFARGVYHEYHHHIVHYGAFKKLGLSAEYFSQLKSVDFVYEHIERTATGYGIEVMDIARAYYR